MNEIHTEVPYSKRCEFCGSHSIATLHANNQVTPTFSVSACAGCLNKLTYGHSLLDVFGWSWCISGVHRIIARMVSPARANALSNEQPAPTRSDETRDLIQDLARALQDYHLGLQTTRPFAQTYGRDEALLFRAMSWLGESAEKGVPDDD